jgi:hypothetical protein
MPPHPDQKSSGFQIVSTLPAPFQQKHQPLRKNQRQFVGTALRSPYLKATGY